VKVTALEEENRVAMTKLERARRTMATQKATAARGRAVVATLARDVKKSREKIARAETDGFWRAPESPSRARHDKERERPRERLGKPTPP